MFFRLTGLSTLMVHAPVELRTETVEPMAPAVLGSLCALLLAVQSPIAADEVRPREDQRCFVHIFIGGTAGFMPALLLECRAVGQRIHREPSRPSEREFVRALAEKTRSL